MDAIYTRGWVIVDDFLTAAEVDALRACLPDEWQPAGMGGRGCIRATLRSAGIRSTG